MGNFPPLTILIAVPKAGGSWNVGLNWMAAQQSLKASIGDFGIGFPIQ